MMEFFSSKLGVDYPYPKYAQVAVLDFIYGGMENTSATTQTALTLHDERAHLDFSSNPLVAHELAHQWFGDLLTCRDWSHAWLNESFATYFEALYTEHSKGKDEFSWELYTNGEIYFGEEKDHYRRAIVTRLYKQPSDLFDRHLYEKGSLVLHVLRGLLGEDGFWKSMGVYVSDNRGKTVETVDLINAIQKATGRNMGEFFDQWVFKAGHPEYRVRYWWDAKKKEAKVRVLQTQTTDAETGLFSLPIDFEFHTAQGHWPKGKKRFQETVDKKSHLFSFKLPSEPILVLFDPDHWILKKVDFPKSEVFWIRQLTEDPHVMGRVQAAQALGRSENPAVVQILGKALFKEPFWAVQGEILLALASLRRGGASEILAQAEGRIKHPKARRFLMKAFGMVREGGIQERLRSTCRQEPSYFVEAQALKALGFVGDPWLLSVFPELMKQESWNDILRCGALEALTSLRPPRLINILKKYTEWGYDQNLRMTAIRCLAQVGVGQEEVRKALLKLLSDSYLLVQLSAVQALSQVGDERAVAGLEKLTKGHLDGRLKRSAEEAIQKIKKGIEDEEKKK
jgi:aminopeptidase N